MAIKIVGTLCGICWVLFFVGFAPPIQATGPDSTWGSVCSLSLFAGIVSFVGLFLLALIAHFRRPSAKC
jgi:threonine/homoserine/homoserine lactone efflux protein